MRNEEIILSAKKINISEIGFTSAHLYNKATGENFKSAIVALFPYFTGEDVKTNISLYARGKDYHAVIKAIFENILNECGISDYKIYADIGPVIDRKLAIDAGLGYIGKNNMLINDRYGTYCFIGYVVCNEQFVFSSPVLKTCIGCNMCIKSCPSKALSESGFFCEERCLSHLTQKKGEHTKEEQNLIVQSGCVFGCDICQNVCPHNKNICTTSIAEFSENLIDNIQLSDFENITNKEFKRLFGERAFSWRGKAVLERNLKYFKDLNDQ